MKNILLIGTGGTIASMKTENGFSPKIEASQLLKYLPQMERLCNVQAISIMCVDSSNMNPERIKIIARTVYENYDKYDGFIIAHGTDTLAFTAAALSYMLVDLQKPIVLTGSQVAIGSMYTDAKQNIYDAMTLASDDICGVFVVFDGKVILGTRAMKQKTKSFDAFFSYNHPEIAHIKYGRIAYDKNIMNDYKETIFSVKKGIKLTLEDNLCEDIMIVKLFPGIKPSIFDYIKQEYKGVIVEGYGTGGIPNEKYNLVEKIGELIEAGVVVVITTQCLEEGIDLSVYEVGRALSKLDVIYAKDMNTEALVMKLMLALGKYKELPEIKQYMET